MKHFILLVILVLLCAPKLGCAGDEIENLPISPNDLGEPAQLEYSEGALSRILTIKFKNGTSFSLPDVPLTIEQKDLYSSLDATAQNRFRSNREWYLKALAGMMRLGYPFYKTGGQIAKAIEPATNYASKSYNLKKDKLKQQLLKMAGDKFQDIFNQAESEAEQKEAELFLQVPIDKTLATKERYRRIVQNTLRSLDQELWNHAPLLSSANEGFVIFQLGAGGGVAIGDTKSCRGSVGCASLNLGLALNPKEKRISLFYFNDVDKLKQVVGVYAGGNAFGSIEFGLGHHDHRLPLLSEKGTSVCPPGPLLGVFTPSSMQFGLGLGPSIAGINLPLPSLLLMELQRYPLFRVSVAATWPFFKIQFGAKPALELVKLSAATLTASAKTVLNSCKYIFSKLTHNNSP